MPKSTNIHRHKKGGNNASATVLAMGSIARRMQKGAWPYWDEELLIAVSPPPLISSNLCTFIEGFSNSFAECIYKIIELKAMRIRSTKVNKNSIIIPCNG